jgi:PIN domain nuclease of toxin-antitoxin system
MEHKLPRQILLWLNAPENEIYFSSASVWEIVIKHDKNPAAMPVDGGAFVNGCIKAGFMPLPIENRHVLAVSGLKRKNGEPPHSDPFDKILVAQAKTEKMTLITRDSLLAGYGEKCVMTI